MAELAGQGALSKGLEAVRTLLTNVAAYRTWMGAADVAAASARTYLLGEYDANATLPCAAVFFSPENTMRGETQYGGAGNFFARAGSADVMLIEETPAAYADRDALDWLNALKHITNAAGLVIEGVEALAGTGTYLNVRAWSVSGAVRDNPEGQKDLLKIVLRLEWAGPGNMA